MNKLQDLINSLVWAAPNFGRGIMRGATADVLGAPIDTLNAARQGLLMPTQAGNPVARQIGGLLGPVQQTGTSDYFAQQMGLPEGRGMAYEAGRMLSPSPTEVVGLLRRTPIEELITYHGTPHRFEPTPDNPLGEFDASKIGTGEGAQAYGHGVYVAESPDVAKGYRESLSNNVIVDGKKLQTIPSDSPIAQAQNNVITAMTQQKMSPQDAIAYTVKYWNDAANEMAAFVKTNPELADRINKEVASRREIAKSASLLKPESFYKDPGALYTADLPDEMVDRMLDWDKPLSEQPEAVQSVLRGMWLKAKKSFEGLDPNGNPIAGQVHHLYSQHRGGNTATVAEELRASGIPGIKYLDAGSRGDKAKPTRNFVLFPGEEKKAKIIKRE